MPFFVDPFVSLFFFFLNFKTMLYNNTIRVYSRNDENVRNPTWSEEQGSFNFTKANPSLSSKLHYYSLRRSGCPHPSAPCCFTSLKSSRSIGFSFQPPLKFQIKQKATNWEKIVTVEWSYQLIFTRMLLGAQTSSPTSLMESGDSLHW